MIYREKVLKTGYPDGRRFIVKVYHGQGKVIIKSKDKFSFLKELICNDDGFFLRNGHICLSCDINDYSDKIKIYTSYIEDILFNLMLTVEKKEVEKDASTNTSDNTGTESRRDKAEHKPGSIGGNKKKKRKPIFQSLQHTTGGDEPPESY